MNDYEIRLNAITRKLNGEKVNVICKDINKSRKWFYKWFNRYLDIGVDGLKDFSKTPLNKPSKIKHDIEQLIVDTRKRLAAHDTLETKYSPIGAESILWELSKLGLGESNVPSISTINRVIKRNNLFDNKSKRIKKYSLPYPEPTALKPNDVHQLDAIGPRYLATPNGSERIYFLNLIDCYSRVVCSKVYESINKDTILDFLINHVWIKIGIPKVLQVDNMLSIKGSNRYPRSLGIIIKLCLMIGVEIIFIPINEPQRNGKIESFNNKLQTQFFRSQIFNCSVHVQDELSIYTEFCNNLSPHSKLKVKEHGSKIPSEIHFKGKLKMLPKDFSLESYTSNNKLTLPLTEGKVSFIRFIKKDCKLNIFSESFQVPETFRYKYVTATALTKDERLIVISTDDNFVQIDYKVK